LPERCVILRRDDAHIPGGAVYRDPQVSGIRTAMTDKHDFFGHKNLAATAEKTRKNNVLRSIIRT
jgi:hypothetical protein